MQIQNSDIHDLDYIFELYRIATDYMKSKNQVFWPAFPRELIHSEIEENRQWKLILDDQIACIWATTLNDELIWGERNSEPSVYIHRIATNPHFRGQNLVKNIVHWADKYCISNDLKYVRLDTVGLNNGLINHYGKLGFDFLGTQKLKNISELPAHYSQGNVCLFQREVVK